LQSKHEQNRISIEKQKNKKELQTINNSYLQSARGSSYNGTTANRSKDVRSSKIDAPRKEETKP